MTDSETNFWIKNVKRIGVFFINTGYIGLKVVLITPLFIKIFEEEIKNIVSKIPIKKIKIALSFSLITLLFSGYLMLLATGRVLETITFYTLLLGSILLHYYFKKLKKYYLVSTIIIFLPVFTLFIHKKNKIELNYNLNLIAQEILFTPLSKYENEIKERHQTLRKSNEKEVLLLPIKTIPRVLYFEEIGDKKEPNYINIQLEKFYKKQGVFLKTKRN